MSSATVYIGLGSNADHPRRQLARALAALSALPRSRMIAASRNYQSAPVDPHGPQADYVNAVAKLATALPPRALLAQLHRLERRQGRRREPGGPRNAPRSLDLDLLLYGRLRADVPALSLPHPRMHQRAFVLRPLADVAPAATIPGHGLARAFLRAVRGQRIAPTRAHRGR